MSDVSSSIKAIITEVCGIDADRIGPSVHLLNELGIDSIDFLDVVHEIDRTFNIKLPVEQWATAVSQGDVDAKYFVFERLVENVQSLIAAPN